ncbi:sigma-70 family RNA polymerase sigma factor [Psittacicella gerlachiana]|uniref:RNA polymerase sigma-70 domain-containing protein n=1 Tax=Psittacicella gerlachiana TaxID=2028574 RepID=A0A3A1Y5M2_9GAMM|nr:sigma-70 family RNA polymerase sigma factor [Psittacicella gerlachiana]RIY31487.1 hypothetical protein CKF59_07595 [Psittacicella gerlachiana]
MSRETKTKTKEDIKLHSSNSVEVTGDQQTTNISSSLSNTSSHNVSLVSNITITTNQTSRGQEIVYYVSGIKRVLTKEIEDQLIKTANDLEIDISERRKAFTTLLQAYTKYIEHLVYKDYKYSNVSDDDLNQAAFEGFVEAVKNYDQGKSNGGRLITYAYHHIKKNISKLVNQLAYATKTITTKDASLAKTAILKIRAERPLTNQDYENIAKTLNNKTASYVRSIEGALTKATSFETDTPDGETNVYNPSSFTTDENSDFSKQVEEDETSRNLREAFFDAFTNVLDEREQYIIKVRVAEDFFPEVKAKATLNEIANKFNISNERVRQIEMKAKEKLAEALAKFRPHEE